MLLIECPHCGQSIEVIELNCRIFRCGIYKKDYTQIDPHLSKPECIRLFNEKLIFGCGKPFQVLEIDSLEIGKNKTIKVIKCDYI